MALRKWKAHDVVVGDRAENDTLGFCHGVNIGGEPAGVLVEGGADNSSVPEWYGFMEYRICFVDMLNTEDFLETSSLSAVPAELTDMVNSGRLAGRQVLLEPDACVYVPAVDGVVAHDALLDLLDSRGWQMQPAGDKQGTDGLSLHFRGSEREAARAVGEGWLATLDCVAAGPQWPGTSGDQDVLVLETLDKNILPNLVFDHNSGYFRLVPPLQSALGYVRNHSRLLPGGGLVPEGFFVREDGSVMKEPEPSVSDTAIRDFPSFQMLTAPKATGYYEEMERKQQDELEQDLQTFEAVLQEVDEAIDLLLENADGDSDDGNEADDRPESVTPFGYL